MIASNGNSGGDGRKSAPLFTELLNRQRSAYLAHPMPSAQDRVRKLKTLKNALIQNQAALCDALSADFGYRSRYDSLISDILPCVLAINYSVRRVRRWMRPQRRSAGLLLNPARVKVYYQPLGVVGIVVPWNFPLMLSIGPLIGALSAGNRAMIKMSEYTPETNRTLRQVLSAVFGEDEVAVCEGGVEAARAFTAMPFDHLLFTGSTAVGREVMRAAADHLTPVTLELGGKSPAIVAPDMDVNLAAERMVFGKSLNAGQICVSPDYVYVPEQALNPFVEAFRRHFQTLYPDGVDSKDYTSVINEGQYRRLAAWLDEAEAKGARIIPCANRSRDDERRRMATHIVVDPGDETALMREEIFGPILPVLPYTDMNQVIGSIRRRPRPLALYLMTFDKALQQRVLAETHSGGVCINETVLHVAADDAPFGGIGHSGMGQYHGREGFLTFSKAKTTLVRGRFNSAKFFYPPYGTALQKFLLKYFLR